MSQIVFEQGRLIDPSQEIDRVGNLVIENGKIVGIDVKPADDATRIDARGKIVCPGLIDTRAQLGEPGYEVDETIRAAGQAALAGGFTTVACLPSTDPPIDTPAGVEYVHQKALHAGGCRVVVLACISKGREGAELSEMGALVEAGAVGFTDAPRPAHSVELLRRALQYSMMFDRPILNYPETPELTREGVMHEGLTSLVLGLEGMPSEAEDVMTSRDLRLAEATGGRLHLINISTSTSVDLLRRAKDRGLSVTAGVCVHNLMFTDDLLRSFDPNLKVKPPLRSQDHIDACIDGLASGVIDIICSGHSPRSAEKKAVELDQAPYGMISLQTTLSVVIMQLIQSGRLTWLQAIDKLSTQPAKLLGVPGGELSAGSIADVIMIDPDATWTVDAAELYSLSANTPFHGRELQGQVLQSYVGGELRFDL